MTLGGAQRVCYNLINWIQRNTEAKVHLVICTKDVTGEVTFDLSLFSHSYLPRGTVNIIFSLRKEIKKHNTDVLLTMGVPSAVYSVPASIGLGIKHVISERNDPAHFAGSKLTKILSRLLMRRADGYVFQTKEAQAYYGGKIEKNSVIIPNPLFIKVNSCDIENRDNREKIIVTTGRLNRQKNHPLLIKAFKQVHEKHPDYRLVIYGEGPERENGEALIKQLGLEKMVLLPGAINNVPEVLCQASLYVLSSNFEGMPNALMEAMALGLSCISTDCPCGGPRELIHNGENGILVPVGDKNALVKAILYMIEHPEKAKAMGGEAAKIRETHASNRICQQWYNYFQEINVS